VFPKMERYGSVCVFPKLERYNGTKQGNEGRDFKLKNHRAVHVKGEGFSVAPWFHLINTPMN